ncbi:MAG: PAS domain S-box protein [Ignavibacteriales bacterium]|nr:PAS domain S-box protein [Ignavibacteriales bacterium]
MKLNKQVNNQLSTFIFVGIGIVQLFSILLIDYWGINISLFLSTISLVVGFLYFSKLLSQVSDITKMLTELNKDIDKSIISPDEIDKLGKVQTLLYEVVEKYNSKTKWLIQLLDSIPFPISVTDMNMDWTFINKPALKIIGKTREELINKKTQCSNWGADICNTERCGIKMLRKEKATSWFTQPGLNMDFQVDTAYLIDDNGKKYGHIEVVQDVTASSKLKKRLEEGTKKLLVEMEKFASGDLTVKIEDGENDAIGNLFRGFNEAVGQIRGLIDNVTEAALATASASTEISSSTEQMAAGAQEQSAQVNEVSAAVEEMSRTIFESAKNANIVASSSKGTNEKAKLGAEKVNESKNGMASIVKSTKKTLDIISSLTGRTDQIGEIAQVIDEIADQTNLLALNAAIEAARAGEQGRGFAVVADEVRKLAERTTQATKEIAETIKAIQDEAREANKSMIEAGDVVNAGTKMNEEVAVTLEEILSNVAESSDQINQLASASEEQSTTVEQISKNVESINTVTQESALGLQQIALTAEDLNKLTEKLQNLVSYFNIKGKAKNSQIKSNLKIKQLY